MQCDTTLLVWVQLLMFYMVPPAMFTGRKKSLRSLEIPLENLLSGIVFLSGTLRVQCRTVNYIVTHVCHTLCRGTCVSHFYCFITCTLFEASV